jgi:hypothetical protein
MHIYAKKTESKESNEESPKSSQLNQNQLYKILTWLIWPVNEGDQTAEVITGDVDIGSLLGGRKVCRVKKTITASR